MYNTLTSKVLLSFCCWVYHCSPMSNNYPVIPGSLYDVLHSIPAFHIYNLWPFLLLCHLYCPISFFFWHPGELYLCDGHKHCLFPRTRSTFLCVWWPHRPWSTFLCLIWPCRPQSNFLCVWWPCGSHTEILFLFGGARSTFLCVWWPCRPLSTFLCVSDGGVILWQRHVTQVKQGTEVGSLVEAHWGSLS